METRRRTRSSNLRVPLVALAAVLVLVVAPSAQGVMNLVPNPGFEMDCSGVPCDWDVTGPSVQMMRDTSIFHSGAASMQVTTGVNGTGAVSNCFFASAGTDALSYWYNTTDLDAFSLEAAGTAYSNSTCSMGGSGVGPNIVTTPTRDGNWHQVTGSFTLPDGTHSMKLFLVVNCQPPNTFCPNNSTANFDDVDLEGTLAAKLVSFSAKRAARRGVVVRWRTGTEIDALGFNVYRGRAGHRVRLNRRLIPALGRVSGGSYSFVDRRAPKRAVRYWLQDVDAGGGRTWHGPVRLAAA
jgi:hypothetical protein